MFTETLYNVDGFVRPYNVSGLTEGVYTIEVSDRGNRHQETIEIVKDRAEKLAHVLKVAGDEGKYLLTINKRQTISR